MRVFVREDTPLPKTKKDFQKFLKSDQNKTELSEMIAEFLFENWTKANIVCSKGINVLCNTSLPTERLSPCNHEEADTRLVFHVNDIVHDGLKRVIIVCTDTDVVGIALNVFCDMSITELWFEFGSDKNCRWLPIHTIAEQLGEETCRALPSWHAFTGCDTVSAFAGKETKKQLGKLGTHSRNYIMSYDVSLGAIELTRKIQNFLQYSIEKSYSILIRLKNFALAFPYLKMYPSFNFGNS